MKTLTPSRIVKIPAAINTPEPLASRQTLVQMFIVWAQRGATRVANSGNVYFDAISTNDAQAGEMTPGSFITFPPIPGHVYDLSQFYVDAATLGDGVFVLAIR